MKKIQKNAKKLLTGAIVMDIKSLPTREKHLEKNENA
jgi:hypothetical protein